MKASKTTRRTSIIPNEIIMNHIYVIRGQKVILDRDLAKLYAVETKTLKRQVNRNLKRFPEDFMFAMSEPEFKNWRYQFGTSNSDKMGLRYAPFCFTELGVSMLSSILNSDKAITVNIQIMRVFTEMRKLLYDNSELRIAIEEIRRKTENNTKNIEVVFKYFDDFLEEKEKEKKRKARGTISIRTRRKIGFKLPSRKNLKPRTVGKKSKI